ICGSTGLGALGGCGRCGSGRNGTDQYGGIGVNIAESGSFSVFPNNGVNTNPTNTRHCNITEIASARRLIFRSLAFCSESPSIKHPPSVPICVAEFLFSSLDIAHLSTVFPQANLNCLLHRRMQAALPPPAQRSQGCEVRASSP